MDQCKIIFSEYGIPQGLISDNGSCYASVEFAQFAKKYNSIHSTTLPHYHESSRFAAKYVAIVKDILKEQGSLDKTLTKQC